jgi:hypothetical protein
VLVEQLPRRLRARRLELRLPLERALELVPRRARVQAARVPQERGERVARAAGAAVDLLRL